MQKIKNTIKEFFKNRQDYLKKIKEEPKFINRLKKRIPNILTESRIVAPLIIIPTSILGNFISATIIAGLLGLTDAFDGYLARKWHATSEYGRKLDVISDKLFTLGLIIPLLITNPIIILPTLLLETCIATVATRAEVNNNHPKSSMLGKVKTTFLYVTLTALYLAKSFNLPLNKLSFLVAATNMSQAATAIQYQYQSNQEEKKTTTAINQNNEENTNAKKNDLRRQINEYKQLKDSLLPNENVEKDFVKTIKK